MGWFGRGARARQESVPLTLYTRAGCHLCDLLEADVRRVLPRGRFSLVKVDVDSDRSLKKRFGLRVPVLDLGGRLELEGRVDAGVLRARFDDVASAGTGELAGRGRGGD